MGCAAPPAGAPSRTFASRGGWGARSVTTRSRRTCGTCCAGCTAPASTWASATRRRVRRAPPTRGSSCSSSRSSCGGPSRTKTSSSPRSCATASGCWNDRPLAASRRRHGLARRVRAQGQHRAVHAHPAGAQPRGLRVQPAGEGRRSHRGAHARGGSRSEEHTSELQSQSNLVCRLLLEKKKKKEYIKKDKHARTLKACQT